jgi:hypothetical protein
MGMSGFSGSSGSEQGETYTCVLRRAAQDGGGGGLAARSPLPATSAVVVLFPPADINTETNPGESRRKVADIELSHFSYAVM